MMKKQFEHPEITIYKIEKEDILTLSSGSDPDDGFGPLVPLKK